MRFCLARPPGELVTKFEAITRILRAQRVARDGIISDIAKLCFQERRCDFHSNSNLLVLRLIALTLIVNSSWLFQHGW